MVGQFGCLRAVLGLAGEHQPERLMELLGRAGWSGGRKEAMQEALSRTRAPL